MTTTTAITPNTIALSGLAKPRIVISPEAAAECESLLRTAEALPPITDLQSAESSAFAMNELSAFIRRVEADRTEAKSPILEIGRAIDGVAKSLTCEVEQAREAISIRLGAWQEAQRMKERERARAAAEEEERIRREASAEIRQKRAEGAAVVVVEEVIDKAEAAIVEARTSAIQVPGARIEGVKLKRKVEFDVVDIVALYEAAPSLVNLTPNKAAIKNALRQLREDQSLPGIRHHWVSKAT